MTFTLPNAFLYSVTKLNRAWIFLPFHMFLLSHVLAIVVNIHNPCLSFLAENRISEIGTKFHDSIFKSPRLEGISDFQNKAFFRHNKVLTIGKRLA